MVVETLVGTPFPPPTAAAYAIKNDARAESGTDMQKLGKALEKDFPLRRIVTNDLDAMLGLLRSGAVVVANVGGDRNGYKGVFSNSGHYVIVLGVAADGRLIIADPYMYSGKYASARRKAAVEVVGDLLYAKSETLHKDAENRNPRYTVFVRA